MKLSDAIRMNGMMAEQGFGYRSLNSSTAPCALGGALQSIGRQRLDSLDGNCEEVRNAWPWADIPGRAHCPVIECGAGHTEISNIVWHLNDSHRWTRTQIADWVALQEDSFLQTEVSGQETHPTEVCASTNS